MTNETKKMKEELPGVKENAGLAQYTSFEIGGPARYLYKTETEKDLVKGLKAARRLDLPFFVMGGGTNILVSDQGFEGLVILVGGSGLEVEGLEIEVEAGTELKKTVRFCRDNSLSGLEWAAGIPGTVGGAVRGNAAAFGGSMAQGVERVRAFDTKKDKVKEFNTKECRFEYKRSVFKDNPHLVILSVRLGLEKGDKKKIGRRMKEHLEYRRQRHPLQYGSAGCIFKNHESKITDPELIKEHPLLKRFNEKGVVPAGYLIERCGLKGREKGGARISEKHANFIVNTGGAKAEEVRFLIELARKEVKRVFGVELEEEIQYLGF